MEHASQHVQGPPSTCSSLATAVQQLYLGLAIEDGEGNCPTQQAALEDDGIHASEVPVGVNDFSAGGLAHCSFVVIRK